MCIRDRLRTERCRKMDVKTSCDECEHHCYKPEERERIRAVMRLSLIHI